MTAQPSERQVLYALVGSGFLVVTAVLVIGAAVAGLVPTWWTVICAATLVAVTAVVALRWKDTRTVLSLTILLFLGWTVGTLLVV